MHSFLVHGNNRCMFGITVQGHFPQLNDQQKTTKILVPNIRRKMVIYSWEDSNGKTFVL